MKTPYGLVLTKKEKIEYYKKAESGQFPARDNYRDFFRQHTIEQEYRKNKSGQMVAIAKLKVLDEKGCIIKEDECFWDQQTNVFREYYELSESLRFKMARERRNFVHGEPHLW